MTGVCTEQLSDQRIRFYRGLQALLEIKLDESRNYAEYVKSLKLMYGNQTKEKAIKLLEGEELFHGLHSPGLSLDAFEAHKRLLEGHEKLQKAKRSNWA